MASGVEELLGELYDMIEDGKSVSMHAEQCKIDRDRALDLMDEIRAQFPVELGEAQKLVAAKEEYIANAKQEADDIRSQAQEQVRKLLNQNEIVQQSREIANEIIKKAQDQAADLKKAATDYCADVLAKTDEAVSQASTQLHQAETQFRQLSDTANRAHSSNSSDRPEVYDAAKDDL